jgi:hypothetical protein
MMQQQQMMGLAQQAAPQAISTVAGQVQQDMENESV